MAELELQPAKRASSALPRERRPAKTSANHVLLIYSYHATSAEAIAMGLWTAHWTEEMCPHSSLFAHDSQPGFQETLAGLPAIEVQWCPPHNPSQ